MAAQGKNTEIGSRDGALLAVLVIVLLVLLVGGASYQFLSNLTMATSTSSPHPVDAYLRISKAPVSTVPAGFLGLDVQAYENPGQSVLSFVDSTSVRMFRWPGGDLSERYNMTADSGAGLIYNDNGTTEQPGWTTSQFVDWCQSISCDAIFTVPAEIDNPSLAASYVTYVEKTLGFHPTYWEIGNEPGLWTHFGIPWAKWSTNQQIGPTPDQYAEVVHSYIEAMKAVDPTIKFIGLGGVGGPGGDTAWIEATVSVNGPNLTAIAIHSYPASPGTSGESVAQIDSALQGNTSIPVRVPADLAEIASVCPSCHIEIIADEFNAASGSTLSGFMTSFNLVPFTAAEIIQGLTNNVTSMDLWELEGGYGGSFFDSSGNSHPVTLLYSFFLDHLFEEVLHTNITSSISDLYALATENTTGTEGSSLFVANLNSTFPARVLLTKSGFPANGSGTVLIWSSTTPLPQVLPLDSGTSAGWVLPPQSVAIWISNEVIDDSHQFTVGITGSPPLLPTTGSTTSLPGPTLMVARSDLETQVWTSPTLKLKFAVSQFP